MNELTERPQFVIVDLDGTLYPARLLTYRLLWRLRSSLPLLVSFQWLRKRRWVGRDFGSQENYQVALVAELSQGKKADSHSIETWLVNDFWGSFLDILETVPRNEVLWNLLNSWKEHGSRLACVSDYREIDERLRRLRIAPSLFEVRLSAEEMGALKPARRIGEALRQRLPFVPNETLWIGDRRETDGALAALLDIPYLDVKVLRMSKRRPHSLW